MQKLSRALLVLTAGSLSALALVASASGTTSARSSTIEHLQQPVAALAVDGDHVAYDLGARNLTNVHATNKVLVWNTRTGKTVKVSGKKTAVGDGTSTGSGVFDLAIAGSRVAWLLNEGGNTESTDFLLTSSVTHPKERQAATAQRSGDNCPGREPTCAGQWLGGLVGSGTTIAFNRWTTDSSGATTSGGLYTLSGASLNQVASGSNTVAAESADKGRVAVLRDDGEVAMYSSSGDLLRTVTPSSARSVALSGHTLAVLTKTRTVEVYYAPSGSPSRNLSLHGTGTPQNFDVQGEIAIYSVGGSVHALNLGSGKDRVVGNLGNRIGFAHIDSAGLAYAANGTRKAFGKATLVFVPLARVAAAVS